MVQTPTYAVATWQKINNPKNNNIHIYLEGDGHAYNALGLPTNDPTPHSVLMKRLAVQDTFDNVVYMARPCQFIMDKHCTQQDWTTGRFAQRIIDAQTNAINQIAKDKQITLVGYSGGAMVSGLIIKQNPWMRFEKWITVAGVLDHQKWTNYFGDPPLTESLNMNTLPNVPQTHFIGARDKTVPYDLARQWAPIDTLIVIDNATHDNFDNLKLF